MKGQALEHGLLACLVLLAHSAPGRASELFDSGRLLGTAGVIDRDFNALVEDLQDAMDQVGTPFGMQNRLLALLAPMHAQIVSR